LNEELQFGIILATFIISLIGTIIAFYRLDYAKRQYDVSVQMLKESRLYWQKRLSEDKKKRRRT